MTDCITVNFREAAELAAKQAAPDLHLTSKTVDVMDMWVRVEGELRLTKYCVKTSSVEDMLVDKFQEDWHNKLAENSGLDFVVQFDDVRYRINVLLESGQLGLVARVIQDSLPSISDLDIPSEITSLCSLSEGLVLVSGPTGSGKSTTLSVLVDLINNDRKLHVITLEDPVEFKHISKSSLIRQRELGTDFGCFNAALKAALREDPDVILLGEMRDPETIRLALTAAETGHLVLATLHTRGASKTIDRILDVFDGHHRIAVAQQLSTSLEACVSQKIIRDTPTGKRKAIFEVMRGTAAIRNTIRQMRSDQLQAHMETGISDGMFTFKQYVVRKGLDYDA